MRPVKRRFAKGDTVDQLGGRLTGQGNQRSWVVELGSMKLKLVLVQQPGLSAEGADDVEIEIDHRHDGPVPREWPGDVAVQLKIRATGPLLVPLGGPADLDG